MHWKGLLLLVLGLWSVVEGRPKSRTVAVGRTSPESGVEAETETKIREKRKYEIPLLRELEEGGVGAKREAEKAEVAAEGPQGGGSEAAGGEEGPESESPTAGALRVKKQSPNNIGGCGKTVCGPVVSARGPVVSDMRAMMQAGKPIISLADLHSAPIADVTDATHKVDRFTPLQARTVDTIVAPIALGGLGGLGYGAPASYSAQPPTIDLAHSFFKPPPVPTMPALAVIAAPHQPSHPLLHLMPHLVPHLMPHLVAPLVSNLGSYFPPHRLEPSRYPDAFPTDIKQPLPPPSYALGADNTLLCQPFRNQRLDAPYDYAYRPDSPSDKSINVTDASKKSNSASDTDEDAKVYDHLRKVNEIKDEIRELNRAAQRIVDQQERLTALQQKQLWGSSAQSSPPLSSSADHLNNPYMGSGYYPHPAWGYSRSNIYSYPRSQDDIDFFVNLLRAGRKMGLLSDVVQPSVLSTIGDAIKGVTDPAQKSQKDAANGAATTDDTKPKADKKSIK